MSCAASVKLPGPGVCVCTQGRDEEAAAAFVRGVQNVRASFSHKKRVELREGGAVLCLLLQFRSLLPGHQGAEEAVLRCAVGRLQQRFCTHTPDVMF